MEGATNEEKEIARIILRHTDKDSLAVLTGESARILQPLVHLPANTLGKIWTLVDQEGAGFLTFDQITQFVRLVGYAQTNEPLTRSLLRKPGPSCRIDGWTPNSKDTEKPCDEAEGLVVEALMRENDNEGYGILDGVTAKAIMRRSGLSNSLLGEIWELVDDPPKGFLTKDDLRRVLRLLSCAQRGLRLHRRQYDNPCPLPDLDDSFVTPEVVPPVAPLAAIRTPISPVATGSMLSNSAFPFPPAGLAPSFTFNYSASSLARPANDPLPLLTDVERTAFINIFNRSNPINGVITGEQARAVFARSQLSTQTLGQIWELADQDKSGTLTQPEFIIAMYLIKGLMDKRFSALPTSVPLWLWAAATGTTPNPSVNAPLLGPARSSSIRYQPPTGDPPTHWRSRSQPLSPAEPSLIDMDNEPLPAPRASSAEPLSRIQSNYTGTNSLPRRESEEAPPPYTVTGRTVQI